jgi:hypothetical protein
MPDGALLAMSDQEGKHSAAADPSFGKGASMHARIFQRPPLRLMLGLVGLVVALAVAGTAHARGDGRQRCNAQATTRTGDDTSLGREKALLKDLIGKGWKPTKAGKDLLAGKLPDAVPLFADDGTLVGEEAAAQFAQLPVKPAATRTLQSAKRKQASTVVFLNCGIGQKANVNFSVVGVSPYTGAWVVWNLVNFQTGASKNVRSAGTNYCPPNSLCLEYFYLKPASPWYVFIATEFSSYPAPPPAHLNAYCGG